MRDTNQTALLSSSRAAKPFRLLVRSTGHGTQDDLPRSGHRHCAVFAEIKTAEPLGPQECAWISERLSDQAYEKVVLQPTGGWSVRVRFHVSGRLNEVQMNHELNELEQQLRELHRAYLARN